MDAVVQAQSQQHSAEIEAMKEGWAAELRRQREAWAAAEAGRRNAWLVHKTREIKEITARVRGYWFQTGYNIYTA